MPKGAGTHLGAWFDLLDAHHAAFGERQQNEQETQMANLNRVLLIGNLTRDPETKYTPHGTAIAEFGLAVNRVWKDADGERQEETTFVDIQLWARLAEIAQEYLRKGSPVFIEGRLKLDTWDDKQTGQKRSRLRVVGENLQLLGKRSDEGTTTSSAPQSSSAGRRPAPQRPHDPDLDVEDIPFVTTIYRDVRRSRLHRRIF